jgi:hypothetical protein
MSTFPSKPHQQFWLNASQIQLNRRQPYFLKATGVRMPTAESETSLTLNQLGGSIAAQERAQDAGWGVDRADIAIEFPQPCSMTCRS